MTELRPREEQLQSWAAQRTDGDEVRFTSEGGWQLPEPGTQDATEGDAMPQAATWSDGRGADGRGADGPRSDDPGADEHEPDSETDTWWPPIGSRWTPSDTVELDLKTGWAALGFDTSGIGIQPAVRPGPAGTRKKGEGRFSGIRRRLGWGLADQAVSSLTNFAVSLYVARTLGGAVRGVQPGLRDVLVRAECLARAGHRSAAGQVQRCGGLAWRRAVARCTGTAVAVGLVAGACMLGAAALLSGTTRVAFIAMGLTMPGLMLQDSWRFAFFALGRGSQAFVNDAVWALAMLPALLALRVTGHEDVFWFVLAWGTAANVAAAIGPIQARVIPRLPDAWTWIRSHRDLAFRYLAENTWQRLGQLRTYALGRAGWPGRRRLRAGRQHFSWAPSSSS